jgi:valyl-tRNA synthetase
MPFITEEIWQKLPGSNGYLMQADFPVVTAELVNVPLEEEMSEMIKAVRIIRNMRVSANISPAKKISIKVVQAEDTSSVFADYEPMICYLAGVEKFAMVSDKPSGHLVALMAATEICLDLAGVIDVEAERARVKNELAKIEKEMAKISVKLENKNFVTKAPAEVVAKIRDGIAEYEQQIVKLEEYQNELGNI